MAERLAITRLGAGGDGVAQGPAGPVFVPYALPGETALVAREEGRLRTVGIESPSPSRIEPFCPYFGRCGGCAGQHIGPDLYGAWKTGAVAQALGRAGLPAATLPLVDAHGRGRRRVTLHGRVVGDRMRVGFMEAGSHSLVEIEDCPILAPELAGAVPAARRLASVLASVGKPIDIAVTGSTAGLDVDLRGSGPPGPARRQRLIDLARDLDLARLSVHGDLLVERRAPAQAMGRASVVPPPGGFLQATAAGEAVLSALVVEALSGARKVADLFSGVGPFALRLAEHGEVRAVESDRAMLAALDRAARATPGLRPIRCEARDLFRRPLLAPEFDGVEGVVLDPPRAGADAQVRQLILSSVDRVVMVSCDPGTFARDAATLVEGGFRLGDVTAVDQFKWSPHVELVGVFRRLRARTRRRR